MTKKEQHRMFYFRIGALPPAVAQIFIRSVSTKTEIRLPLFCPGLEEFGGDSPPSSLLPDKWVFGGKLGKRIYDDVMSMESKSVIDSCRDIFTKHGIKPSRVTSKSTDVNIGHKHQQKTAKTAQTKAPSEVVPRKRDVDKGQYNVSGAASQP